MPPDDIAISVSNLTKTYRIFGHPGERLKQAMTFGLRKYHKEFSALNLESSVGTDVGANLFAHNALIMRINSHLQVTRNALIRNDLIRKQRNQG